VQTSFLNQLICIHGNPHNGNGIEETNYFSIYFPGNIQKYFSSQVAIKGLKLEGDFPSTSIGTYSILFQSIENDIVSQSIQIYYF
jgi:hypothetical protein